MNLILENYIDWPLVLSQPRYAGGHEEVMRNIFGKNAWVIGWWHEGGYDGTIAIAYQFPTGEVVIMTDYYGSCSGCDAWEGSTDEDARNMILGLCGGAKQFSSVAMAASWIQNMDSEKQPWEYPWRAAKNLAFASKIQISEKYKDVIGHTGSQRIQEIYVEKSKIWIGLDHCYDIGMNADEAKKLIDLLNKAVQTIS